MANRTPHSTGSISTPDSSQPDDTGSTTNDPIQEFFENNKDYLIAGFVIGCILVALVIAVLLWIKRRKRLTVSVVDPHQDKGDGVYVEIAETSTNKKKKKKKSPRQNNNPDQAVELVTLDTAPDIITAHDSDSIYETIDGRRAARAKAGHLTAQIYQSGGSALPVGGNVDVLDPNYDHLSRYTKRRPPYPQEEQPGKRCTDPEISRRQKTQPVCRKAHSADEDSQARKGFRDLTLNPGGNNNNDNDDSDDEDRAVGSCESCSRKNSPADSVQSSTGAMAERRGAGGKRILCQLTMLGVVENGKPVPMPRRRANNAYFVLEPGSQAATLDEEESFQRLKTCKAKFQVRAQAGGGRNACAAAAAAAGSSEYFVLQPLDQDAEEDLTDLNKTMSSPSLLNPEEASHTAEGISRGRRGRFSVHGQRTVSSFVELDQDADSDSLPRHSVVFRDTRLHSCPEASPSTESSPRNSREYRRSLSSPRCSRSEEDRSSAERRVDADWLKARIQREMRALGFISDTEPGSNHDYATAVVESDSESDAAEEGDCTVSDTETQNPPTPPPLGPRPPRNEYFILEPEQDSNDSDNDDDDETDDDDDNDDTDRKNQPSNAPVTLPVSRKPPVPKPRQNLPQPKAETSSEEKPRYQRQYTTQAVPPRLPHRNPRMAHHTRSRSETPFFKPSCPPLPGRGEEEEEQGPVVVSLKKSKSVETSSAAATAGPATAGVTGRGVERRESTNTRPRIKSAHSILS